jgi:hypothetical protein
VVPSIIELEKRAYEALGADFQKYNQKMRQLDFNLKVDFCILDYFICIIRTLNMCSVKLTSSFVCVKY